MADHKILYLSSEIAPFAKVGGLADVANAYPTVLKELECDIRVFIPKYKIIRDRKYNLREVIRLRDINVPLGSETLITSVKSGFITDTKVQAYFLEYKPFFDRNEIYVDPATKQGWADNFLRYAFFAKAAFEMLKVLYWQPDVIHCNDWQSAMVPYFLKTVYKDEPFFKDIKTVLTIHNLAYQGINDPAITTEINADTIPFDENHPAFFYNKFNFLKAGIMTADFLTTVSPTYAKEIVASNEMGYGLEDILKAREDRLVGVLNGIDPQEWDPETDSFLEAQYSVEDLAPKQANRTALLSELKLDNNEENMVVGMVTRLVSQKGLDLVIGAIDRLMSMPIQLVILGTGQKEIEEELLKVAEKYPGRISLTNKFDNRLAHLIEAGSDAFLMPSLYEPCGLNQMYSQRYGTPPIVRKTGGLADSVSEFDPSTGEGTGFVFEAYSSEAMLDAISRALTLFKDKEKWRQVMINGMQKDMSWMASAEKYLEIYDKAMSLEAV
ncbi:glycogen synthase GlgA [bacterium]|nr:glycogen synthase GlgA [bacterium]